MVPPRWFTLSIDEDVQALVWAKDYLFDKNEIGSMLDYSRWMKAGSQTLKTKDGFGLGLIDWPAHEKALRSRWVSQYNLVPFSAAWKRPPLLLV